MQGIERETLFYIFLLLVSILIVVAIMAYISGVKLIKLVP